MMQDKDQVQYMYFAVFVFIVPVLSVLFPVLVWVSLRFRNRLSRWYWMNAPRRRFWIAFGLSLVRFLVLSIAYALAVLLVGHNLGYAFLFATAPEALLVSAIVNCLPQISPVPGYSIVAVVEFATLFPFWHWFLKRFCNTAPLWVGRI